MKFIFHCAVFLVAFHVLKRATAKANFFCSTGKLPVDVRLFGRCLLIGKFQ